MELTKELETVATLPADLNGLLHRMVDRLSHPNGEDAASFHADVDAAVPPAPVAEAAPEQTETV